MKSPVNGVTEVYSDFDFPTRPPSRPLLSPFRFSVSSTLLLKGREIWHGFQI